MSIATRHPDVRPSPPPPFAPPSGQRATRYEHRNSPLLLSLVELDPRDVVEGVMTEKGFLAADVVPVGPMREACPHCAGVALQLVLRHRHVKRSHLFCRVCTRCYDALNDGGHSVLTI
ncbi:hypothetical protein Herbaro_00415 [Herbaspirillum sp. WKF16]|jgi:hypothetical protein|uniref:hypothetical protein n=1 Tax=Herbaspirillum sp. WKF16 TaxID=3028312 RepID=UPI0023A991A8|nr:hypothetical protein [Herbaspirillum sp. WKF16]WDZ96279.1 hypothetical protein Herbaro_00415 [Herbaspirillum sp. WKF16]